MTTIADSAGSRCAIRNTCAAFRNPKVKHMRLRAGSTVVANVMIVAMVAVIALCVPQRAAAYSVLAHEANIDALWDSTISKMLVARFPGATPEELLGARAYAYGGCVIQDLGYYPFGSHFFSNLLHYVRTGDFVEALIDNAQDIDEYAFALGALGHYAADNYGHPIAVEPRRALDVSEAQSAVRQHRHLRAIAEEPRAGGVLVRRRSGRSGRVRPGRLSQLHRLQGRQAGPRTRLP